MKQNTTIRQDWPIAEAMRPKYTTISRTGAILANGEEGGGESKERERREMKKCLI